MPLKPLGKQSAQKPKTNEDVLRELLNPLQSNALKTVQKVQKQQIEEAMQQGVPPEHILEQLGITTDTPNVNMSSVDKTQTKPQGMSIQSKPASSPFGFGGMSAQDGQFTEQQPGWVGGILASLLGGSRTASAESDLRKLLDVSKIQQAPMNQMREERLQRAEERLSGQLDLNKSAEQRRKEQFQVRNLQYFGASVTPEMLQDNPTLNSVITPLVKKFGITPEVNPDTNEITFEIPMQSQLEQKSLMGGKIEEKELASMAEKLPNLDRAMEAIKELKSSFNSAWNPQSIEEGQMVEGILERLRGTASIPLESWTQVNPELHTYLSNVGAFSSLISKGGFLEAGVLTNQDIQRVIAALPKPGYSKERVSMAWRTIDNVLGSARKSFEAKKKQYTGKQSVGGQNNNVNEDKWKKFQQLTGRGQ